MLGVAFHGIGNALAYGYGMKELQKMTKLTQLAQQPCDAHNLVTKFM